jgi:hypothetical protein
MEDCTTWDENNYTWDEISLNWETCFACFVWSDTNQIWQYSTIVWGKCDEIPVLEPVGDIDVGYNIAIPSIFVTHDDVFPVKKTQKKVKKIALTIRINSERYREEKVKKEIDCILKSVRITEDSVQKTIKISIW